MIKRNNRNNKWSIVLLFSRHLILSHLKRKTKKERQETISHCFVLLSQFTNRCPKAEESTLDCAYAGGIIRSEGWDKWRRKHLAKPLRKIRFPLRFEGKKSGYCSAGSYWKIAGPRASRLQEKHCISHGRHWVERELTVIPSLLSHPSCLVHLIFLFKNC